MKKVRNTSRKELIRTALKTAASIPIILEELRWIVMRGELHAEQVSRDEMNKSDTVSFNRSLRTFLPEIDPNLLTHKVERAWTAGLLARVAVFRLKRWEQVEQFLSCNSTSIHFWSNARTADVWDEVGDGKVEVHRSDLLPPNAPDRLPSLYPGGSRWPRGGATRRASLEEMGPKYVKHPVICAKLCLRDTELPQKGEELAIVRIPAGLALTVIGSVSLNSAKVGLDGCQLYLRRRKVTRKVEAGDVIA